MVDPVERKGGRKEDERALGQTEAKGTLLHWLGYIVTAYFPGYLFLSIRLPELDRCYAIANSIANVRGLCLRASSQTYVTVVIFPLREMRFATSRRIVSGITENRIRDQIYQLLEPCRCGKVYSLLYTYDSNESIFCTGRKHKTNALHRKSKSWHLIYLTWTI